LISAALAVTGVLWYQDRHPHIAGEDIAECLAAALERRAVYVAALSTTNLVYSYPTNWPSARVFRGEPEVSPFRVVSNVMFAAGVLRETLSHEWDTCSWLAPSATIPPSATPLAVSASTSTPYTVIAPSTTGAGTKISAVGPSIWDLAVVPTIDTRIVRPEGYVQYLRIVQNSIVANATNIPLRHIVIPYADITGYAPVTSATIAAYTNAFSPYDSWWRSNFGAASETFIFPSVERIIRTSSRKYLPWGQLSSSWLGSWTHTCPNRYITSGALDEIRSLCTNMTALIMAPAGLVGTQTLWNVSVGTNNTSDSTKGFDLYAAAGARVSDTLSGAGTQSACGEPSNLAWFMGDYYELTGDVTNSTAGIQAEIRRCDLTFSRLPVEAYASGMVARVRIYLCAETSPPLGFTPLHRPHPGDWKPLYDDYFSTNVSSFTAAPLNAHAQRDMGYSLAFADLPSDLFPPSTNYVAYLMDGWNRLATPHFWMSAAYPVTNRVWTLALDATNPSTPPTFTLAPDPAFALSAAYEPTQQVAGAVSPTRNVSHFFLYQSIRIVRSIAIVDLNFKHFATPQYAPTTNYPAWTTNSLQVWTTNSLQVVPD